MNSASKTPQSATPIVLLGETRKRIAEARLTKCVNKWRQEWSVHADSESDAVLAPCAAAVSLAPTPCCVSLGRAAGMPCVYVVATDVGVGAALGLPHVDVTGECISGELAAGVAREVTASLAQAVLAEAQYQAAQIEVSPLAVADLSSDALTRWWSVAINAGVTLFIAPQLLALLAPAGKFTATENLDKRRTAIGGETIALEAVLGEAQVSVGELSSLRVNDVVVLNGTLAQPGYLRNRSGKQVASVSLGRVEGKRAVVIVK